jgi:hypothetical protein
MMFELLCLLADARASRQAGRAGPGKQAGRPSEAGL